MAYTHATQKSADLHQCNNANQCSFIYNRILFKCVYFACLASECDGRSRESRYAPSEKPI